MSFNYFVLLGNKITLKFKLRSIWFTIFIYWKSKYVSITIYLLLQWFKKNKLTQRKISLKMLRVKVKKIGRDMEILLVLMIIMKIRVRHDTFFQDLRSLTIILPNHDLGSLTIIFWKSHDRRSQSWSAIILPITINVSIKAQKTKSNLFYSISISKNFSGWTFLRFQAY